MVFIDQTSGWCSGVHRSDLVDGVVVFIDQTSGWCGGF